jgi:chemotaxis protein histidine kinase CheA
MNNFLLIFYRSFFIFYLITHTVYGMEPDEKSFVPSKKKKSSRQEQQITKRMEISLTGEELVSLSCKLTSDIYNFSGIKKKLKSISPTHQFTDEQIAVAGLFLSPRGNSLAPNANEKFQSIIGILNILKTETNLGKKMQNVLAGYECYASYLWLKDKDFLVSAINTYGNGLAVLRMRADEETRLIYENAIKENKNKRFCEETALDQEKEKDRQEKLLKKENMNKENERKKIEEALQKKRDHQAKEEHHRKTALENAARAANEEEKKAREAAEKTRLAEETRKATDNACQNERAHKPGAKARLAEETRKATDNACQNERAHKPGAKARQEEEIRKAAEKDRLEEEAREAARIEAQRIEAARIETAEKTRQEEEIRKKANRGTILEFCSPVDIIEKNITEEKQSEQDEKLQSLDEKTSQRTIDQYFFGSEKFLEETIRQLNQALQEQANEIRRLKAPKQTRHGKSLSV